MFFRYYGGFEQGLVFAVLIMNALSNVLDREMGRLVAYGRRRLHGDS